jgi:hypothetical protein
MGSINKIIIIKIIDGRKIIGGERVKMPLSSVREAMPKNVVD